MHSHEVWQPSFWSRSTSYLSEDVERLQKRAMEIIYPDLSYAKALELSALLTLYDRKEAIAAKLFDEICANKFHSLHKLFASIYRFVTLKNVCVGGITRQATPWESTEHLFIHSVKLKDWRIAFF